MTMMESVSGSRMPNEEIVSARQMANARTWPDLSKSEAADEVQRQSVSIGANHVDVRRGNDD